MSKIYTDEGIHDVLKRVEQRLDKIDARLSEIDRTLIVNTASLDKHILRTELSEQRLNKIEDELIPVSKHVTQMSGALKFIGILSVVTGFVFSLVKLIDYFLK
jgi:hypothetical protein